MAEARSIRNFGKERILLAAPLNPYEVVQTPTGKAGYYNSPTAAAAGDYVEVETEGQVSLAKTTSMVLLAGGRCYWDASASTCSYRKNADRDFYVGRCAEDATSAQPTALVNLNDDPRYDRDLARDGYASVLAGTPAAGAFGYPVNLGGAIVLELTATNEAQKVDALGIDGWAVGANAIIEGAFRVISDGAGTVVDVSLGLANGTHATDADSITEHLFVHLDANNTNINLQSKDGTTTVASTDSTTDYTEGSTLSCRKEFWIDTRNPADCQVYIDGVLVLDSTVFNLNAGSGPWFLLAHAEKTSSTDTYKIAIDWLRAHFHEQ